MIKIIEIDTPKQISSKKVYNEIERLILSGVKSSDILLQMNFICDSPKIIIDKFRVIKNTICFKRDISNGTLKTE